MNRFRRAAVIVAALAAAATLSLGTDAAQATMPRGAAQATMPHGAPNKWTVSPATMPRGSFFSADYAAALPCPSDDGDATWGKAKVCYAGSGIHRVHYQDAVRDGRNVQVQRYSSVRGAFINIGPEATVVGQWRTFATDFDLCNSRLKRVGTVNSFRIPTGAGVC